MSHRSRRTDDRDYRSHSSHKHDKYEYEYRHHRDDSRDRSDRYYSSKSSYQEKSSRSRYKSRSRSPSHSSRRHRRSRSRSHSRHDRNRSYRSKDYNRDLPDSKGRRDSRERSPSKHNIASNEKSNSNTLTHQQNSKHEILSQNNERGPTSISHEDYTEYGNYENAHKEPTTTADPNDPDGVLEAEKQRIQKETLERLQKHFEKEGKSYPPPRPQASHPIFANDGSFLEMFKSMQGNLQHSSQQQPQSSVEVVPSKPVPTTSAAPTIARLLPVKRRGAKILKTGIVQKQRATEETDEAQPSDSWNAYLKEVKRYKTVTCSDDNMTRSLVK